MNNYPGVLKAAASLLLAGVLSACGGGGGGGGGETPVATTFTVAGTAATGAPFAGATVTLIDSTGATFAGGVTGADGSYSITLPLTAKPPFVVQAARDDQTLVSVVAEAKNSTANITPVTNLIASRLSTSGDPAKLAAEIQANPALVDATKLTAKVAEIVALIKPLMDAVGDSTNPLNGTLVANGTGADKVLDSLSITITPNSTATVNIEVSVKQKLADGVSPAVISFTNATAPATPIAAVTAADLVPSGTATLIADFLKRLTACYALPQSERVNSGGTAATDIKATACKDIFLGNDPASYLNNGARVSSTGAFSGIFGTGTGVTFDRGTYEFTRSNGDLVIAYRSTNSAGSTNNTLPVRADTDGKLRAIGNQYKYNGGVNAYHQLRNFVSQPAADYYSTGYSLYVSNTANVKDVAKVVVTSPTGNVLTLKPSAGSAYFPLVKTSSTGVETLTGTNFVRIRSVYVSSANSAKNPADADTNLFFRATPLTDAEIAALPAQGTWKFEYYLASTPTVVDATQYYKTRARAMTIPELQAQPLASLTNAVIAGITSNSVTANGATYLPTPTTGPIDSTWVVPAGALAPTSIQVFGNSAPVAPSTTRPNFNDSTGVASTARSGNILCSTASTSDTHCSGSDFAAGARLTGFHLWANDATGREFAHFYAFYTVTIP